jgi:hypothetical protein
LSETQRPNPAMLSGERRAAPLTRYKIASKV